MRNQDPLKGLFMPKNQNGEFASTLKSSEERKFETFKKVVIAMLVVAFIVCLFLAFPYVGNISKSVLTKSSKTEEKAISSDGFNSNYFPETNTDTQGFDDIEKAVNSVSVGFSNSVAKTVALKLRDADRNFVPEEFKQNSKEIINVMSADSGNTVTVGTYQEYIKSRKDYTEKQLVIDTVVLNQNSYNGETKNVTSRNKRGKKIRVSGALNDNQKSFGVQNTETNTGSGFVRGYVPLNRKQNDSLLAAVQKALQRQDSIDTRARALSREVSSRNKKDSSYLSRKKSNIQQNAELALHEINSTESDSLIDGYDPMKKYDYTELSKVAEDKWEYLETQSGGDDLVATRLVSVKDSTIIFAKLFEGFHDKVGTTSRRGDVFLIELQDSLNIHDVRVTVMSQSNVSIKVTELITDSTLNVITNANKPLKWFMMTKPRKSVIFKVEIAPIDNNNYSNINYKLLFVKNNFVSRPISLHNRYHSPPWRQENHCWYEFYTWNYPSPPVYELKFIAYSKGICFFYTKFFVTESSAV